MNTPNPLTAAMEEAVKELKEHPAARFAEGAAAVYAITTKAKYDGPLLTDFLREKMEQAFALGKQEGMENGIETGWNRATDVISKSVQIGEGIDDAWERLDAAYVARTAHRGDSGKEV